MKRNVFASTILAGLMLGFVGAAGAAEVFAEPESAKSGQHAYRLSAFVDKSSDGLSFTLELPAGVEKVSLSGCGFSADGALARCYYEPTTRKLAVALIRMDGKPLDAREYDLGRVAFSASGAIAKLQPIEVANVRTASRGSGQVSTPVDSRSTNAER